MKKGVDDVSASQQVVGHMRYQGRVTVMNKDYNGAQFKAVIGMCECLIACRMHAAIAAVSQCVPTLILAYNHKTHGIIGRALEMQDLIIDIRDIDIETFKEQIRQKAAHLIENTDMLKNKLSQPVNKAKEKSEQNFYLCRELMKW